MMNRLLQSIFVICVLSTPWTGCDSNKTKPADNAGPPAANGNGASGSDSTNQGGGVDEKLPETLLEPFDPPSLAELDAKAEWEDQPVIDSIEQMRERQKGEPALATVPEALQLRNTSPETNAKILSALGRLPENDGQVDWDATMSRHLLGEVKSTNPLMISSVAEFEVIGLTGFGLFGTNAAMQTTASKDSVVRWQSSKDRMYDKIVMRDDLTWSDGHPITAHDIVFSFKTIMNPRVPVPAVRSGTDKLRWVEAYDDQTLVFFHKQPLATNVGNISFTIIPKHIYENSIKDDVTLLKSEYHVNLENNPIVGGAYEIVKRVRGQEIILQRRESAYMHNGKQVRDKPYFKQIRFRIIEDANTALLALKSGEIHDLEFQNPELWISQTVGEDFYDKNTKASGEGWTYFYFGWNNKTPFFDDIRVRKAMSYAFDYREMLDKLQHGMFPQCSGIFHPNAWMAPKPAPTLYKQDLDLAEKLLDEAGWVDSDGDGIRDKEVNGRRVPFEFSLIVRQDAMRVRICELMKFNLSQIGITCNVTPMEATVLQERVQKREFQASFGGWGTGSDPDTSDNVWVTNEGRNFLNYSNLEVDKLYQEGREEFDREKRAAIYARIAELIFADQPCTFLYTLNNFYGFNKQLRGYNFSPRGPYSYSPGFGSIWKVAP